MIDVEMCLECKKDLRSIRIKRDKYVCPYCEATLDCAQVRRWFREGLSKDEVR